MTNIGNNLKYWQIYEQDYNGEPTLTFRDTENQYQFNNKLYINLLSVDIECIGYIQETTKLVDSCNILSDIKKALIQSRWSDEVTIVRPKTDSKKIEGKGKQALSILLTLEIEYRETNLF